MNHTDPHELASHDARTYADAARAGRVAVGRGDSCDGCAPRAMKRYAVPTFRRIAVVRTEGGAAGAVDGVFGIEPS
jgi:hypothetical protein